MKFLLSNVLFVVALFLCLSVQYGSGLSCYECNDRLPTTCKELTSTMIKDCGYKDPVCSTEWFHDSTSGKNLTYVRRACANFTMTGSRKVFFKSSQVTVMYCTAELCNAAGGVASTIMMLVISAVLPLFILKDGY